jgi:hypothetical protein
MGRATDAKQEVEMNQISKRSIVLALTAVLGTLASNLMAQDKPSSAAAVPANGAGKILWQYNTHG